MNRGAMRFERPLIKLPIRFSAETLAEEIRALPPSAWVPHPQGFEGNDAVPLVSVGGGLNDGFAGPMAATEHLRRLPYVMSLMEELGGVWGRSRLMGLAPGAVVPGHVDIHYYWQTHVRIHVPVITNPGVRFTCGGDEVHMQPGETWIFDSFRLHEVRNEGTEKRIHLVLDTVGGDKLWNLIEAANSGTPAPSHPWRSSVADRQPDLRFEQVNLPALMSPWEIRCLTEFLLGHVESEVPEAVVHAIDRFIFAWHAVWAEFGESNAGHADYARLIRSTREELARLGAAAIILDNEAPISHALDSLIFSRALKPPKPAAAANPKAA